VEAQHFDVNSRTLELQLQGAEGNPQYMHNHLQTQHSAVSEDQFVGRQQHDGRHLWQIR
jgi:hypothetical protein